MSQYHLKRLPAPKQWSILRKVNKYITRPRPGGHKFDMAMPLSTVVIALGKATTKKEVKTILRTEEILIDGRKRYSVKQQFGFMDILTFPKEKESYRMMINDKGLYVQKVSDSEAKTKLCKITKKITIKNGKTQIHTLDGRNILLPKDNYKVGDTLLIGLPKQDVQQHFKLEKGVPILLFKGSYAGKIGAVEEIKNKTLKFTSGGKKYETKTNYAFVVGKEKPVIKVD